MSSVGGGNSTRFNFRRLKLKNPPNDGPAGSGVLVWGCCRPAHHPPPLLARHIAHSVPSARVVIAVIGLATGWNTVKRVYYGPAGHGYVRLDLGCWASSRR